MTPEQALEFLFAVSTKGHVEKADHIKCEMAKDVLMRALNLKAQSPTRSKNNKPRKK